MNTTTVMAMISMLKMIKVSEMLLKSIFEF